MFKKSDFPRWLILYVLAILVVAGVIDLFMYLAIPTAPGLNAPTWLTFWGSYLGGAIGCLPLWRPSTITARRHASSTRKPKEPPTCCDAGVRLPYPLYLDRICKR